MGSHEFVVYPKPWPRNFWAKAARPNYFQKEAKLCFSLLSVSISISYGLGRLIHI